MAQGGISLTVPQMPDFLKALVEAPKVQMTYMKQELDRGAKRIRKSFISAQLMGPPGINAQGKLSKGKNVITFVEGSMNKTLSASIGISRILHVHEKGLTIAAKGKKYLAIHAKGSGPLKSRPILALVKQVVIPARLHFVKQVRNEAGPVLVKVAEAGQRATNKTVMKALGQKGLKGF